ncbi:hypothetical protein F5Y06DRAFT_275289 [Hypoxylon sp. FL0890]|nr:hypothetical protein F5Y06DRAFT_275289 [Hypoxylon sp. FL0890]
MEVLGTVAAAGQLIGTAVRILDSIAQLRDFLQHAPARYQGWHSELAVLDDTISCIRHNSALQTSQISRIIEGMAPKIETLTGLCLRHSPESKGKLVSRVNRALTARTVESRILQNFQSLEHDKTTLILTISTLNVPLSIQQSTQARQNLLEDKKREMEGGSSRADYLDRAHFQEQDNLNHSGGLFSSTQSIQRYDMSRFPNPDQSTAFIQQLLRNSVSSQSTYTAGVGGLPIHGINGQRSTFKNIKLNGNGCLFGDSLGKGADFEGINIVGHGRVDGVHLGETASAWSRSSRPFLQNSGNAHAGENCQGTVIPTPMEGVLESSRDSKGAKCSISEASDASKTGMNEGDSDEMDIDKD